MGKSAKFAKRPTRKVKEALKEAKKLYQVTDPAQKKNDIKINQKSQASDKKSNPSKKATSPGKSSKATGKPPRILEGRPDYVDLMYGRPKSKK